MLELEYLFQTCDFVLHFDNILTERFRLFGPVQVLVDPNLQFLDGPNHCGGGPHPLGLGNVVLGRHKKTGMDTAWDDLELELVVKRGFTFTFTSQKVSHNVTSKMNFFYFLDRGAKVCNNLNTWISRQLKQQQQTIETRSDSVIRYCRLNRQFYKKK